MNKNTGKAGKKLACAKELLDKGGQENTDLACAILLILVRQKRGISIRQSTDAAALLSFFLEEKNKDLEKNIEKMRQDIEKQDIVSAVQVLHCLAENYGYLSDKQKEELIPIKVKFLKNIKIVIVGKDL